MMNNGSVNIFHPKHRKRIMIQLNPQPNMHSTISYNKTCNVTKHTNIVTIRRHLVTNRTFLFEQLQFLKELFIIFKANRVAKQTLEEIVGSMALRSRTNLPSRQKVRLARGKSNPGSVQQHFTSGPIFSITSNLTIPPSTRSSSPTLTSAVCQKDFKKPKQDPDKFL